MLRKISLALILFFTAYNCCAATNNSYPGGIATLKVPCSAQVYFQGNRVLVVKNHTRCNAIIGIPLAETKSTEKVAIKLANKSSYQTFTIHSKKYEEEHFTIKKSAYIKKPSPKLIARIKLENKIINEALNHWSNKLYTNLNFRLPATGRISSPFGLERFVNGKLSGRHRGLDIAAPRGTKVRAPASGYVLNTGRYFLTGNTVIIDHGRGLTTIYCHLSKIIAKPGNIIRKGQVLGLIGSTGRSTGPHLHWGATLNHTRVNPLLLIRKQGDSIP